MTLPELHYLPLRDFLRMVEQWPECVYIATFDMTVQLLGADRKHLGSIAINQSMEKWETSRAEPQNETKTYPVRQ